VAYLSTQLSHEAVEEIECGLSQLAQMSADCTATPPLKSFTFLVPFLFLDSSFSASLLREDSVLAEKNG